MRGAASLVLSMMLVVVSLSLALVSSNAGPASAVAGVPAAPTPVYAEDFQNRPGPAPVVKLTGYTGTTGQAYTAAAGWLTGCNGWIAAGIESTALATAPDCLSQANWNTAQRLAVALGMANGQTPAVALNNYAVSAYTANNPGAGAIEFATATNIPLARVNRFVTFSVDVAAVNCSAASHPLLQFSLINSANVAIPMGGVIDGCGSATTVNPPAVGASAGGVVKVGNYTAGGAVLVTGNSFGVRMVNNNGSGGGNDHAFDNIRILDVTPQLDKSFTPNNVGIGQPSTLTLTITNTSELGAKAGWSFTDNLPAGMTVAGAAATTCPATTVVAPIGATTVAVNGSVGAGMASCTITVVVTSTTVGALTNGTNNISPQSGMEPPAGDTTITYSNQPALTIVKSSTTATLPGVGVAIPYTFRATNTGNVTVTAVSVSDPNATGIICPVTSLAPTAFTTCTATHTVTQADLDANVVVNTAHIAGTSPTGSAVNAVSNTVTITGNPLPALSIVKSSPTVTLPAVGETIPYNFRVTNTGNVTINSIAVTDPNTAGVTCSLTMLAPTEFTICTGTHTVTQAEIDAGQVVNTASVLGNRPNGTPIPAVPSNQVTINGAQNPALSIVKSTTSIQIPLVGETVPYDFLVTNTGNVSMTGIAVTDPNTAGTVCPVTTLAPGIATTCTGTHTVTQTDIDGTTIVNTATVTGTVPNGTALPPGSSNTVTIAGGQNPELSIVKASTTTAILALDETVPYTFAVVNTGNLTMTAVAVADPNATAITCPAVTLAPGEATTCTGTHTVTQADIDAGIVINTAQVIGTPPSGTAIAPVTSNQVRIPVSQVNSLTVFKSATAARVPGVGSTIPYMFTVTNNGNVTMTAIAVTDPNATGISCSTTTLAPGESTTCTGIHAVTQADINNGSVVNTASVVGTTPGGTAIPAMPSNQVTIPATQSPALSIIKSTTTTQATALGQTIPYTFVVTNIGNVTMSNTTINDPKIAGVSCPQTTLAVGESMTCSANYTVTQADIDAGRVVNVAAVSGTPPNGAPIGAVSSNEVVTTVALPAVPVTPAPAPGPLPATGRETATTLQIVLILVSLGSGLLIISRRRKQITR